LHFLGLVFILINVGAIATPIAGVVLAHSNNLSELIIPPEIEEVITKTTMTEESLQLPQYINSSYDLSTRIAHATFNFTNPFDFTLQINTISADIKCSTHDTSLGQAALNDQVQINEEETQELTINFMWTEAAEAHFLNEHFSEASIEIQLETIQLDISGINIAIPEQVTLTLPIIQ
jgi:hypothetical protein